MPYQLTTPYCDATLSDCRMCNALGLCRSDFECCGASPGPDYERPRSHYNMYNKPSKIKVAGCAWDFSLLRDKASPYNSLVGSTLWPVEGEGPYLKLGPAKATW